MIQSSLLAGMTPRAVQIEVELTRGLPRTQLLGLPGAAVREAADRALVALAASGFELAPRRTTINLHPADEKKMGAGLDLAIALALLEAHKILEPCAETPILVSAGLSLDGRLSGLRGCLATLLGLAQTGFRHVVVAPANLAEACLVPGLAIHAPTSLRETLAIMQNPTADSAPVSADNPLNPRKLVAGGKDLTPAVPGPNFPTRDPAVLASLARSGTSTAGANVPQDDRPPDLADVQGQNLAKRALEIAAAGSHNLLLCGPPGSGKTMLAKRLPGILPPMSPHEQLAAMAVHGIAGLPLALLATRQRPFRQPHHSITRVGLVGGGRPIAPGEIALANHGVLFLDEFPEFHGQTLEALREPLEDRQIVLQRMGEEAQFPTDFLLVAAMNPCPCGRFGLPNQNCTCSNDVRRRYQSRLSGPLLDRIDLHVRLPPTNPQVLRNTVASEDSAVVRDRVLRARSLQKERNGEGRANASLSARSLQEVASIQGKARALLEESIERLALTARAYHRILRVGLTLADLEGAPTVEEHHIAEAVQYRDAPTPF